MLLLSAFSLSLSLSLTLSRPLSLKNLCQRSFRSVFRKVSLSRAPDKLCPSSLCQGSLSVSWEVTLSLGNLCQRSFLFLFVKDLFCEGSLLPSVFVPASLTNFVSMYAKMSLSEVPLSRLVFAYVQTSNKLPLPPPQMHRNEFFSVGLISFLTHPILSAKHFEFLKNFRFIYQFLIPKHYSYVKFPMQTQLKQHF